MKTGVIIYITGDPPLGWTEEKETEVRQYEIEADMVRIITRETGHFDVFDAWFELAVKGMSLILCKFATFNETGQMRFTGRELRLCG